MQESSMTSWQDHFRRLAIKGDSGAILRSGLAPTPV